MEERFILLQEILWPNRWQSTVACILLNRTKRSQVDKVWPTLFQAAPTPEDLLKLQETDLQKILQPLGLSKIRSSRLKKMAAEWLQGVEFEKLTGVGEYAIASDKIFYRQEVPETINDHALVYYVENMRNGTTKKREVGRS